ncbi:hypothetical protein GGR28_001344 [Lewinella aquimaris]|uniref:Uncharacterized protein n=1 Tax=Neolewinella aquimaris TaxID=1835722 RepID=A0A840E0I0_9BACT|nr:hypothetical protein [Neolewinella aquimaris]MBB4078731.1 hypothetical protein [Neolewinella aquimaris]
MPSSPSLNALLRNPSAALADTDLKITLPLTRALLNEVLAARPAGTPIRELYIDPEAGNRFRVHLSANAPVIGTVSRQLMLVPGPAVSFPDQPWLSFDIVSGLKFLDKPLINLVQGQIESRLPKGVDVSSSYVRIHVPALMTHLGYQQLVPLINKLQVTSEANRLILSLHLNAQ